MQNNSTIASDKVVLGNSLTVNAKAAGGAGDYTYAVLYKKTTDTSWVTKQNFTTNTTVTVKPSNVATYDLCVKVKDSALVSNEGPGRIANEASVKTITKTGLKNRSSL